MFLKNAVILKLCVSKILITKAGPLTLEKTGPIFIVLVFFFFFFFFLLFCFPVFVIKESFERM